MHSFSVRLITHQKLEMALRIHAVQVAAYRQEAALLCARRFAPLERTVDDVMGSRDLFFGAFAGEELLGVISLEQQGAADVLISSLTVAPSCQRRGVARALVVTVAARTRSKSLSVSTGANNGPAIALYEQLGFVVRRHKHVGPELLEIVELCADRSDISMNAAAREHALAKRRA